MQVYRKVGIGTRSLKIVYPWKLKNFTHTCLTHALRLLTCQTFGKRIIFFLFFLMHLVEASKCKGINLLKNSCWINVVIYTDIEDERVLQHVVSVTVISSAHIKGNSISAKCLSCGKFEVKKNTKHHGILIHQNPD